MGSPLDAHLLGEQVGAGARKTKEFRGNPGPSCLLIPCICKQACGGPIAASLLSLAGSIILTS
jgi:hypothetical protein